MKLPTTLICFSLVSIASAQQTSIVSPSPDSKIPTSYSPAPAFSKKAVTKEKLPPIKLFKGKEIRRYHFFGERFAKRALWIFLTGPIRIFCENTLPVLSTHNTSPETRFKLYSMVIFDDYTIAVIEISSDGKVRLTYEGISYYTVEKEITISDPSKKPNKAVLDKRLPPLSRNDPRSYNP